MLKLVNLHEQNNKFHELATHQWLRSSGLKGETEGFILAAQDQSFFMRNYQANAIHNGADSKCRFCDEKLDAIDRLVFGCSILTPNEYKNGHDRVGQYLHWKIFFFNFRLCPINQGYHSV